MKKLKKIFSLALAGVMVLSGGMLLSGCKDSTTPPATNITIYDVMDSLESQVASARLIADTITETESRDVVCGEYSAELINDLVGYGIDTNSLESFTTMDYDYGRRLDGILNDSIVGYLPESFELMNGLFNIELNTKYIKINEDTNNISYIMQFKFDSEKVTCIVYQKTFGTLNDDTINYDHYDMVEYYYEGNKVTKIVSYNFTKMDSSNDLDDGVSSYIQINIPSSDKENRCFDLTMDLDLYFNGEYNVVLYSELLGMKYSGEATSSTSEFIDLTVNSLQNQMSEFLEGYGVVDIADIINSIE